MQNLVKNRKKFEFLHPKTPTRKFSKSKKLFQKLTKTRIFVPKTPKIRQFWNNRKIFFSHYRPSLLSHSSWEEDSRRMRIVACLRDTSKSDKRARASWKTEFWHPKPQNFPKLTFWLTAIFRQKSIFVISGPKISHFWVKIPYF